MEALEISEVATANLKIRLDLSAYITIYVLYNTYLFALAVVAIVKEQIEGLEQRGFTYLIGSFDNRNSLWGKASFTLEYTAKILEANAVDPHALLPTSRTRSARASRAADASRPCVAACARSLLTAAAPKPASPRSVKSESSGTTASSEPLSE